MNNQEDKESKYSKPVNPDFYLEVKIFTEGEKNLVLRKGEVNHEPGFITVPWTVSTNNILHVVDADGERTYYNNMTPEQIVEHKKQELERKLFIDDYDEKHAVCPKCGSSKHMTTLMGYIFDRSKPESYKDLNRCTCECGNVCSKQEMISVAEFNSKQQN